MRGPTSNTNHAGAENLAKVSGHIGVERALLANGSGNDNYTGVRRAALEEHKSEMALRRSMLACIRLHAALAAFRWLGGINSSLSPTEGREADL